MLAPVEESQLGCLTLISFVLLIIVDDPLEQLGKAHQLGPRLPATGSELADHSLDVLSALVGFLDQALRQAMSLLDDPLTLGSC
jgi:hypothetical protein